MALPKVDSPEHVRLLAEIVDEDFALSAGILPDAEMGRLPMHNVIPRLSATPGRLRRPAPALGEHTAEILGSLGLDHVEIEGLAREAIIGLAGGKS